MKVLQNTSKQSGYTLPEALVYITVLVFLAIVTVSSLIALTRTFVALSVTHAINQSATALTDRMVREIRSATSIDIGASTLGSTPGHLVLNTTDDAGDPTTIEFYISGDAFVVKEGAGSAVSLVRGDVIVTPLVFERFAGVGGQEAVWFTVTLTTSRAFTSKEKIFSSGAVLRGGY
jgi:type II secretory pathway pseudopilin PulG